MDAARGDEIPYWEPPMRMKEHAMETMDSHELCPDGPSEDGAYNFVLEMLARDPIGVAEAVAAWVKGNKPMDPRKGPNQ